MVAGYDYSNVNCAIYGQFWNVPGTIVGYICDPTTNSFTTDWEWLGQNDWVDATQCGSW